MNTSLASSQPVGLLRRAEDIDKAIAQLKLEREQIQKEMTKENTIWTEAAENKRRKHEEVKTDNFNLIKAQIKRAKKTVVETNEVAPIDNAIRVDLSDAASIRVRISSEQGEMISKQDLAQKSTEPELIEIGTSKADGNPVRKKVAFKHKPQPRMNLNDDEKLHLVKCCEKYGYEEVAEEIKIDIENLRQIKSRFKRKGPMKKRGRKITHPELDKELCEWVLTRRKEKKKVTAKRLLSYSKNVAKSRNLTKLTFSWGWLQKFMARHRLALRKPSSKIVKPFSEIEDAVNKFIVKIQNLLTSPLYDPQFVINLDETGVSTESNRAKTLEEKGTAHVVIKSTNKEKENTTVLLGGSMAGEKLKPLVILKGKRATLDVVTPSNLLVHWREAGSWMDRDVFKKYIRLVLKDWSSKIPAGKRGLLLLDNFKGHIDDEIEGSP